MQSDTAAELFERAQLAERRAHSGEALDLLATCGQWPVPYNERGLLLRAEILIARDPIAALDELPETADAFTTHEGRVGFFLASARAYMNARNLRASEEMMDCAKGEMFEGDPNAYRLAWMRALLRWTRRQYDPKDGDLEFAISSPDAMERFNAINLRAWMHSGNENYREQLADLLNCMRVYRESPEKCRVGPVAVALQSILGLAWEIGDAEAVRNVLPIIENLHWTQETRSSRFAVLRGLAWHAFLQGNDADARRFIGEASDEAPTPAWELLAYADSAYIAHLSRDEIGESRDLRKARATASAVNWSVARDEERVGLLRFAILLGRTDFASAGHYVDVYRRLYPHSMQPRLEMSYDPGRVKAMEQFVEGRIAHMRGNARLAARLLENAYAIFRNIEFVLQATLAAHALFQVTGRECWLASARKHAAAFPGSKLVSYITP